MSSSIRFEAGLASLVLVIVAALPIAAAAPDGLQLEPRIAWTGGDHEIDLQFASRFRWELWEARTDDDDNIYGIRTRLGIGYSWKNRFRVFAEGQLTHIADLDANASGSAGLYRANASSPNSKDVTAIRIRQLYAEGRRDANNWLRVGRQDIKAATLIEYPEPNWNYLKMNRVSRRLIGGVGWTNGERSYDGIQGRVEDEQFMLHVFAAEPTTGVFEIDSGYKRQRDVVFGGFDLTVKRGVWLPNTELRAFFIGYSDDRSASKVAGLFGDVEVYTIGLSSLGVHRWGPGNFDLLIWAAMQFGDYHWDTPSGTRKLDHVAGAAIAEVGYQLPDVWAAPWLRAGVNFASGDDSPDDDTHNTFFNLLPTNHLYYGYADQLAFQNLIDFFVQLKLAPLPKTGVEIVFHRFWLPTSRDYRYFGSGAFTRTGFGFGRSPSNGSHDVGHEVDVVVRYQLNRHVDLMAGYAKMIGGEVFQVFNDQNTDWAFAQIAVQY